MNPFPCLGQELQVPCSRPHLWLPGAPSCHLWPPVALTVPSQALAVVPACSGPSYPVFGPHALRMALRGASAAQGWLPIMLTALETGALCLTAPALDPPSTASMRDTRGLGVRGEAARSALRPQQLQREGLLPGQAPTAGHTATQQSPGLPWLVPPAGEAAHWEGWRGRDAALSACRDPGGVCTVLSAAPTGTVPSAPGHTAPRQAETTLPFLLPRKTDHVRSGGIQSIRSLCNTTSACSGAPRSPRQNLDLTPCLPFIGSLSP